MTCILQAIVNSTEDRATAIGNTVYRIIHSQTTYQKSQSWHNVELRYPWITFVNVHTETSDDCVWDLPAATHSKFVTSLCGLPQLKVELACRCVKFIGKCLNSSNYVVKHVVKQGVYFQRLYSPIGRNSHHCVTMVDASLSDIVSNTRKLSQAWYAHHDTG